MRDKLIEALLVKGLLSSHAIFNGDVPEGLSPYLQQLEIRHTPEDLVNAVVNFVAEWLETEPEDGHRPALPALAADWRRDMS